MPKLTFVGRNQNNPNVGKIVVQLDDGWATGVTVSMDSDFDHPDFKEWVIEQAKLRKTFTSEDWT